MFNSISIRRPGRAFTVVAAASLLATAVALLLTVGRPAGALKTVRPVPDQLVSFTDHHLYPTPPTTDQCLSDFQLHCYSPAQMQKAYDLAPLFASGITGRGQTIVIVDSFGSPTIQNDLHVFDQAFGLPDPPSLRVFQPAGPVPAYDPSNGDMVGWAQETTLDVEWSHVMAPGANIVLLETPVSETEGVTGFPEIVAAENWALSHNIGDVISMSFGATEQTFPSPQSVYALRSAFIRAHAQHVALLSSSGDDGATDSELDLVSIYPYRVTSWPTSDPLVTSVGGTQITLDDSGNRLAPDVVWNDPYGAGGGGLSTLFSRPDFQSRVANVVGRQRGVPDISMNGAVDGGVIVYTSFDNGDPGNTPGFDFYGGTSASSPEFAGIVALADQLGGRRVDDLNARLYSLDYQHGLVDITQGNNTYGPFQNPGDPSTYTVQGFDATPGYDLASGLGTFDAAQLVPALVGHPRGPWTPPHFPNPGPPSHHGPDRPSDGHHPRHG